jgi:hypothetical protein
MPRYLFAVRHPAFDDVEDDPAGMELPDDAAAREFAVKVMRRLAQRKEDNWDGWTMEVVTEGGRRVWELPFNAIEPSAPS